MNAAEQLVEAYFQHVGGCLTRSDVKVHCGAGRQFDLIAYSVPTEQAFHIEVDVTHKLSWSRSPAKRAMYIEKKFFGVPPERTGASSGRTDFERGKCYFPAIRSQYSQLGLNPDKITRVLVSWVLHEDHAVTHKKLPHLSAVAGAAFAIHFLSFRNLVLPALLGQVGTSNYENEMLRILSLTKQRDEQINT